MTIDELRQLLVSNFPQSTVHIDGDEANFSVNIIDPGFKDINNFNRQKKVLACVKEHIVSGEIHAFSVQAFSPDEWDKNLFVCSN